MKVATPDREVKRNYSTGKEFITEYQTLWKTLTLPLLFIRRQRRKEGE